MPNLPYVSSNQDKVLGILKMYSRMGAYPLDSTSVFTNITDLLNYVHEAGSYAYAGQIVAVANTGDFVTNQPFDYSLYIIRSTGASGTVQEIGKNLTFNTMNDATTFISDNPAGIRVGQIISVLGDSKYDLYVLKSDRTLQKVSVDPEDLPEDLPSAVISSTIPNNDALSVGGIWFDSAVE